MALEDVPTCSVIPQITLFLSPWGMTWNVLRKTLIMVLIQQFIVERWLAMCVRCRLPPTMHLRVVARVPLTEKPLVTRLLGQASDWKDMGYPMGWYWYGRGGYTIPPERYGTAHGPNGNLSLLRLAYYLDRLSFPGYCIISHTIRNGIGMVCDSPIPYHTVVWGRTPISHTIPYLSGHYLNLKLTRIHSIGCRDQAFLAIYLDR